MIRTVTEDGPPRRRSRPNSASRRAFSKSSYSRVARIPRNVGGLGLNSVHTFSKTAIGQVALNDIGFFITGTSTNRFSMTFAQSTAYFYNFALNFVSMPMPGYVELSALFDQVMIDRVVVKFTHTQDPSQTPIAGASNNSAPMFYSAIDLNDANVPALPADIQQYSSLKSKILSVENGHVVRTIRPMFAQIIYASAVGSSYRASRGFLTNNVDVPHYGLKCFILMTAPGVGATSLGVLNIEIKYFYKCKNVV